MNIVYPMFFMFALTAFVSIYLASLRMAAVKSGDIDPRFFRSYRGYDEPEKLRVASRHLVNHFEAPVLFYVACILVLVTGIESVLPVYLAWVYVAARYAHTYIHLGTNTVIWRFRCFLLSMIVLVSLWVVIIWETLSS